MTTIVGIDLGSYSVKVVRLEGRRGSDYEVTAYDTERVPEGAAGDSLADRHFEALVALRDRGALDGQVFVTALPGEGASIRTLSFPFSDVRKIEAALPFELESEIPFDIEDVVYSWTLTGQKKIQRVEVSGEVPAPETEVLVGWAKSDSVAEHLALFESVGIDPRRVQFDAMALVDLFDGVFKDAHDAELTDAPAMTPGGTVVQSGPDAPDPAVAMVDIGHHRTNVCIIAQDRVVGAHTILHGGADATRNLAREIGISLQDAERGKRTEAFIEVLGAEAQFPEQRRASDILKKSYAPILRRLRQVFQSAMGQSRVRVVKIVLTGGGSRIANLQRHMSDVLNVHTVRGGRDVATRLGAALPLYPDDEQDMSEVPEAAGALAYAFSGLLGEQSRSKLDFRTGEFAWRGELDFIRDRAATLGVWTAVILLAILVSGAVRIWTLGNQADELTAAQVAACKALTGQEIESTTRCLNIINDRITGQSGFVIPEDSAADMYLEVSRRVPPKDQIPRKVTELDINDDRIRIKGETSDYDGVDKIVAALQGGRCFSEVEKGKARDVQGKIEWNAVITLDCAKKPEGDELPEGQITGTKKKSASRASPAPTPRNTTPTRPAPIKAKAATPLKAASTDADRDDKDEERQKRIEQARERARERAKERAAKLREARGDKMPADVKRERIKEQQNMLDRIREQRGLEPKAGGKPLRPRPGVMPRIPTPKLKKRAADEGDE